jgi:cell cycle arrest protein BUB3
MSAQYELDSPPSDAISSLQFSPNNNKLLVGSWDRTISIYKRSEDGSAPFTLEKRVQCRAPVLDVCWGADESVAYFAGLDHDVRRVDLSNDDNEQTVLSRHEEPSNKVAYNQKRGLLLSTGWDGVLHAHNTAIAEGGSFVRVRLPSKPFAMSLTEDRAIIAMAERKMSIYDLLSLKMITEQTSDAHMGGDSELGEVEVHEMSPWQTRESNLKFMTRAVAAMPDGTGFATSSIEGRVAVEWFEADKAADTYAFKCHRQTSTQPAEDGTENEVDIVYPVNALTFNKVHGTFATGGGDGVIAFWDAQTKRRVRQYQKQASSVAALDFSADGKYLAIGVSPGFEDGSEEGEIDQSLVKVVVRELSESEAKGKAAK